MKWFKHMSNASSDGQLIALLEQEFGIKGYAWYFKLLEAVAAKMEKIDDFSATYPWAKWESKLKGKRKQLSCFFVALEKQRIINVKANEELLTIEIPKLAQLRDNHTKNLQVSGNKVSLDKDIDKELDIDKNPLPPEGDVGGFEIFWKAYPKKTAKEYCERIWKRKHLSAKVQAITDTVERYKVSPDWKKDNGRYIPNPSTFLNQGRWLDEVPQQAKPEWNMRG